MSALAVRPLAMSSREIAELTGKGHKNVLADARKMLAELGKATAEFSAAAHVPGPNGSLRRIEVLMLPKRETLILVSGYSVVMRAAIIDRWQELEAANDGGALMLPDFSDPVAAARAWADAKEGERQAETARVAAQHQLVLVQPKVEYAEALLNSEATVLVGDVAKTLGVGVRKLFGAFRAKNVLLSSGAPAAEYVKKGYLVETQTPFKDGKDVDRIRLGVRVTTRGIEFCRRLIARHPELFGLRS